MKQKLRSYIAAILVLISACGISMTATAQDEASLITEDEAFAAVFADPGNVKLNFQLVSIQLQNQHFKEAAGTLERILILLPDNPSAQLLLARVQIQLGNLPEAKRLAGLLVVNETATEDQRKSASRLSRQIDKSKRRLRLSGSLAIGGGVADNPEGGSIENAYLAADVYGSGGTSKRATAEEFMTSSFVLSGVGKLTSQLPEDVTISLTGSTRDYSHYDAGDVASLGVNAGYSSQGKNSFLRTSLSANRLHVQDKHYLNTYSGGVTYLRQIGAGFAGNVGVNISRKVFKNSFADNTSAKSGSSQSLTLGLSRQLAGGSLQLGLVGARDDARAADNDKSSGTASLQYVRPSNFGLFNLGISYKRDKYRVANSIYSSTIKRQDNTNTATFGYSIGLNSFSAPQPDEPSLLFSTRYGKSKSNIANFSKYSGEASLTLTSRF